MKGCLLAIWVCGMVACQPGARGGAASVGRAAAEPCAPAECERACQDRGEIKACTRAAELYWDGANGHPFDPKRSFRYATRGCDSGDGLACTILGQQRENGIGTEWAPKLAVADYDKACAAGAGLGCALLGAMYFRGHGVDADPEKVLAYVERARTLWSAACQGEEPRWCTHAALLVGSGADAERLAQAYNRRACDHGIARGCVRVLDAQLEFGTAERSGVEGELSRLCHDGEPTACVRLARIEPAQGDRDALRRAAELTVRACKLGMSEACLEAGILFEAGEYVRQDDAAKQRHLGAACDRGRAEACLYLAQDAATRGAPEREIERLDQRACELGNFEACSDAMRRASAQHDDVAAVRFATEACRMGGDDGCKELIVRDTELPVVPNYQELRYYHAVCDAGHAPACERLAKPEAADAVSTQGVLDAITRQDAPAFAKRLLSRVQVTGLWFADRECARQFSGDFPLTADRQPAFLRCLATLDAHLDPPGKAADTAVLAYEPGLAIHLGIRRGVVEQIWTGAPQIDDADAAPIDADLLASHLVSGTFDVRPEPAAGAAGRLPPVLLVDLNVCVDPSGRVDRTWIGRSSIPSNEGYARTVQAAVAAWQFTPFVARGKPVRVCAIVPFSDPPEIAQRQRGRLSAMRPPSHAGIGGTPLNVPPTSLDALRIAGDKVIAPDDATKTAISVKAGPQLVRLIGSFKLCLSSSGRIQSVTSLKTTGVPAYDQKLIRTMRSNWRYRPFMVNGVAAPVCTAVTFIYSQH
jgi:TPR repeat protein